MKLASLFSGGKDSVYATHLTKKEGHEIACLISMFSENPDSYMFHTPNIELVKKQAEVMGIPLVVQKTKGEKEKELEDLEKAIKEAKKKYNIGGVVTGALYSEYQRSRIRKICDKLRLECINPLWHKNEFEYLEELIKNKFKVIIVGVFAEGLDKSWLGREIDKNFIEDIKELNKKYKINVVGEGGEFETFVLDCPLFKRGLEVVDKKISDEGNSFRLGIGVEKILLLHK